MPYSDSFKSPQSAKSYEEIIYKKDSYDDFIWLLQAQYIREVISMKFKNKTGIKHLDFACGTGRIIGKISQFTSESLGLDISSDMIDIAREKYPTCNFLVGNILHEPDLAGYEYDLITAFRFFLNAEKDLRISIMRDLSSRIRDQDSLLIFNIHGHKRSLRTFSKFFHIQNIWFNEMSMTEIQELVESADLEIINILGFGLFTKRFYNSPLKNLIVYLEKRLSNHWLTNYFGSDLIFICKQKSI